MDWRCCGCGLQFAEGGHGGILRRRHPERRTALTAVQVRLLMALDQSTGHRGLMFVDDGEQATQGLMLPRTAPASRCPESGELQGFDYRNGRVEVLHKDRRDFVHKQVIVRV